MQSLNNLEAYFEPAKNGDMSKYQILYLTFIKEGFYICRGLMFKFNISYVDDEEVEIILSEMFIRMMKKFDPKKSKLGTYCECIIKKGLTCYLSRLIQKLEYAPISLDADNSDGISLLDVLESTDYEEMMNDINVGEKIYSISSKSKSKNLEERVMSKIVIFRLQGLSTTEICKKLKISIGRYRYLIEKNKNNEAMGNIKIDLK